MATAAVLVVGQGGGGGGYTGGGGGAGGYVYQTAHTITVQDYPVVVGADGGQGAVGGGSGSDGEDSSFDDITADGGGGGADNTNNGRAGGSGGGAGAAGASGGSATSGQGNAGGSGNGSPNFGAGGGGGAGSAGVNGTTTVGGNGGTGIQNSISGTPTYYAGGGGGGTFGGGTLGTGGSGIGGDGGGTNHGDANTGSGGGGQKDNSVSAAGNGGSGIVIIRYLTGEITATGGTITTDGDYTVHTFTSDGTFSVSACVSTLISTSPSLNRTIYKESPDTAEVANQIGEWNAGTVTRRLILKFDLSSIPSTATITSAKLELQEINSDLADNARTARVYRLKRVCTSGATWNKYDGTNSWQTPGGTGENDYDSTEIGNHSFGSSPVVEFHEFILTASKIKELIDGTMTNNGFILKMDTEDADMHQFDVFKLTVNYNPVTAVVKDLIMNNGMIPFAR